MVQLFSSLPSAQSFLLSQRLSIPMHTPVNRQTMDFQSELIEIMISPLSNDIWYVPVSQANEASLQAVRDSLVVYGFLSEQYSIMLLVKLKYQYCTGNTSQSLNFDILLNIAISKYQHLVNTHDYRSQRSMFGFPGEAFAWTLWRWPGNPTSPC